MASSTKMSKAVKSYLNSNAKGVDGINDADISKVVSGAAFGAANGKQQFGRFMGAVGGNLKMDAHRQGKSVLGAAGGHAVRGAAWGGVAGGTIEAAQGGSFWDGAKQGAFNGAVGWASYRTAMSGVGAKSLNPLNKSGGIAASGKNLYQSFSKDANVSKQASSILNNRQMSGVAYDVMRQRKSTP